jgi:hypothetical protein
MSAPATCDAPIGWEALVAYWADDADAAETDRVDEHLLGCETCSAESARVAAVAGALRALLPPFLDHARLEALRARGFRIRENPVRPDQRQPVVFAADIDLLIHKLEGLDLTAATNVSITITVEETGALILAEPTVPFDRGSGEVLIACQPHFAGYPPNVIVEVRTSDASGSQRTQRYPLPHIFEARPRAPRAAR